MIKLLINSRAVGNDQSLRNIVSLRRQGKERETSLDY